MSKAGKILALSNLNFHRERWTINKELSKICSVLDSDMEKAVAPHSSTLAWKIPRTEEPGRLQSMGSLRVGHH